MHVAYVFLDHTVGRLSSSPGRQPGLTEKPRHGPVRGVAGHRELLRMEKIPSHVQRNKTSKRKKQKHVIWKAPSIIGSVYQSPTGPFCYGYGKPARQV